MLVASSQKPVASCLFKKQTEWNGSKKRNLAGFIFSILGLIFYLCVDIFELE